MCLHPLPAPPPWTSWGRPPQRIEGWLARVNTLCIYIYIYMQQQPPYPPTLKVHNYTCICTSSSFNLLLLLIQAKFLKYIFSCNLIFIVFEITLIISSKLSSLQELSTKKEQQNIVNFLVLYLREICLNFNRTLNSHAAQVLQEILAHSI